MALTLRLRRAIPLSSSVLNHITSGTSSSSSPLFSSQPFTILVAKPIPRFLIHSQSFKTSSVLRSYKGGIDDDSKIGPDDILFEGCDYNHWLITIDFPKDPRPSAEEMVETYVQTAAKVFGSEEEAKKRIYACSTTTYQGFQVLCDEATSEKFRGLPGVVFILPDSYIDPVNKQYGGDKYDNGVITPRPPPIQYSRGGRDRNRDQQRYGSRDQPQQDRRGYGGPQQPGGGPGGYGSNPPQSGGYGGQPSQGGSYGGPPPRPGGYGGPPPQQGGGYGGPPPPQGGGYGGPPPRGGGYGGPPPQTGGYGGPPPRAGGYGGPPPQGGGYGGPQPQGGWYGGPPPQGGGYGGPPPQGGGYGGPPPQTGGYGGPPPHNGGYGGGLPSQGGGYGVPTPGGRGNYGQPSGSNPGQQGNFVPQGQSIFSQGMGGQFKQPPPGYGGTPSSEGSNLNDGSSSAIPDENQRQKKY